jgi:hypothetical protein
MSSGQLRQPASAVGDAVQLDSDTVEQRQE